MFGLSTLIRRFGLRDSKVLRLVFGGDTWTGKPVTPDSALQIGTIWALVRLISGLVSTLPLGFYQRQGDGGRKSAADHPVAKLLRESPNAEQTPAEFLEGMIVCLLIYGNAFAEKTVGAGQVRALTILHPELMAVRRLDDGSVEYAYNDPKGRRVFAESDIWHLKGLGFGGIVGLSPIAYARQTLATVIATDEAAARTFRNGMRPSGFFTYDAPAGKPPLLTPEQRAQAREALIEPFQGSENTGRIGILEAAGGFKWEQVNIPPKDAEMLETRRWHVEEMCRWYYNTPPILVGHSSDGMTAWGTGIETIMLGWLVTGLDPLLIKVEQSMCRALLAPADRSTFYLEFVRQGLLRADAKSRGEMYSKMAQIGAISPNQIADRENLERFEGGDEHFINSTMVPIRLAGQRPTRVQPAPGEPIPEPQA